MKASPLDESLPLPSRWTTPRHAADGVVEKCHRAHGFQAEHDFWLEFRRIYEEAETRVEPGQRFAFATEVDARLARMGLAPWSLMSRVQANGGPRRSRR